VPTLDDIVSLERTSERSVVGFAEKERAQSILPLPSSRQDRSRL
jgi:hypothetical protein